MVVILPQTVEAAISRICSERNLPPLLDSTRQALYEVGEAESLITLKKIGETKEKIRSFDKFVMYFIVRNRPNCNPSPQKRPSPSSISSPFSSPGKIVRMMMSSPGKDNRAVQTSATSLTPSSSSGGSFSPQLVALGELQFRKAFLLLNYIGSETLENLCTANEIRDLKDLAMDEFEQKVWVSKGRIFSPSGRCKSSEWESGMTHNYYCHVSEDGSYTFKGPYLDKSRNHLQRVLGDENVLNVKFADITDDKSSTCIDPYENYRRIARDGITVGLRHFRFFLFKDGGKEARKKDATSSSVRCFFVRFESHAHIDNGEEYVLSGKTIQQARSMFMHIHTMPNVAKYMARFSLILSKTMKLEVDMKQVDVKEIDDIACRDEDGKPVCNNNGEPRILTDGTGYISEDLALKCPKDVYKGSIVKGKLSGMNTTEPHHRVPFRLFNNGFAVKGTLLVNKKLPRRTIEIRPSMIKVRPEVPDPESDPKPDPKLSNPCTINSLEVVTTSNQPKKYTSLSKDMVALLSYGGVPDDFFMEILKNKLEESQSVFTNKRTALKAVMILKGIPLNESYLQYRMSIMLNEERKSLRKGKLPIPDSYYLMGTVDPSGVLESDEVSIILDDGQISGKVLVYHPPGLHFGDIHVLNAKYVAALDEFVGEGKYGIFFSCKGLRSKADEMAGADFDGDQFFVSRNAQLLKYFKVSEPWIEKTSTSRVCSKKLCDLSKEEELEAELFRTFLNLRFQPSYALSNASHCWTAIMDRLLTMKDGSPDEQDLVKKNLLRLVDIYYEALDAPKNGKKIEVPPHLRVDVFPHYMEKENSFVSTSILGKIYDFVKSYGEEQSKNIEVRKLPLFEGGFTEESKTKWSDHYKQYKQDMTSALSGKTKEEREEAANAVYNNYKKILYGTAEKERPVDKIYEEARAIYNVCYDHAREIEEVGKCGFAWKVAGRALLDMYVSEQGGNDMLLSCSLNVLKELL
ncbi:RNA-dependent RNA polymerase, eukaryotic-type [Corchorus capsularis]|uniref:RNA-dependent RNA polymerase n=1 Tax=Corchorus capsularis TaxID=210143 RepID=A0A1R3IJ95_COCAP|nr:RNA-dependent RNA polymerase, eukaryotic-type [Corchorus capsularis]